MRLRLLTLLLFMLLAGCNLNAPEEEEITPVPTPVIPTIEFLSPSEGDRVVEGFDMTIDLVARDETPGAGIARIELLLNGEVLREAVPENDQPVPVFRAEMNWISQGEGLHVISAIAYRRDGTPSDEKLINLEVVSR